LQIKASFAADASSTFLLRAGLYLTAFAVTVVISRALGPDGRGVYFFVLVTASTLVAVAKLGLEQANVYLITTRRIPVQSLAAQNALASVTAGIFFGAVLLLAPYLPGDLFANIPTQYLLLAAATVPITLHAQLTAGLQILQHKVAWSFLANLIAMTIQFVVLATLASANALDVTTALASNLAGVLIYWALILAPSERSGRAAPRWNRELLTQTIGQSLVIHVGMVFLFLHFRLDAFIVMGIAGAGALGVYSLAVALAETVLLATDSLSIALLPRQLRNTISEAAAQAVAASRLNIVIGLLASGLWIVVGWALIPFVFGGEFDGAYVQVALLLPGMVAFGVQRLTGPIILRAGESRILVAINGGSVALTVMLDILLVPTLGGVGAAIASSVSYSVSAVCFMKWTLTKGTNLRLNDVIPRPSDAALLVAVTRKALAFALRTPSDSDVRS
jgi:O-antigen/teichoic acid export membrane protein